MGASGTCWAIVNCALPVPGGSRCSSPQATSLSICCSAPMTIGARQITGVSLGTRKPVDMQRSP